MGKIDEFLENLRKKNIHSSEDKDIMIKKTVNQIKKGEFKLNDIKLKLRNELYLGGKIEIPVPIKFFDIETNTSSSLVLTNKDLGIVLKLNYFKEGVSQTSIEEVKENLIKDFKENKFSLKWIEGGECGNGKAKLSYGTYKNTIENEEMYNAIIYKEKKENLIIGQYSCKYKDLDKWENFIKGSIMLIKINR